MYNKGPRAMRTENWSTFPLLALKITGNDKEAKATEDSDLGGMISVQPSFSAANKLTPLKTMGSNQV